MSCHEPSMVIILRPITRQVVVIPKSFHLNDLEYFNMPMIDFRVALEKGEIDSQFYPTLVQI